MSLFRRRTVSRQDSFNAALEALRPQAFLEARQELDETTADLSARLRQVSDFIDSQPATARAVIEQLRRDSLLPDPRSGVSELAVSTLDGSPFDAARSASLASDFRLAESTLKVAELNRGERLSEAARRSNSVAGTPIGRSATGPSYDSLTFKPPSGKGRVTYPEAERSLSGDVNSSFFTSDVHNKVRKVALYQAWLGESWASSSIDAIASRIVSGGWLLEPVDKKKPNPKTKWWVKDFFDWCNVDEEFHGIIHSGITDLGWAGECYLEVTWRYNRTLHREIPYELYTVDPISMEYVLSPDRRRVIGYKQVNDLGEPIKLDPKQVIRVWFPDPRNRVKALSPLEKLLNPLVLDMYLQASEQKYFQQGNRGDLAILAKRADRTAATRLMDFIEEHALGLKNAHRPLVIYADNDDIQLTPLPGRDTMDVPGRREAVRKEISGGMHVPPHQLGIVEGGSIGGQGATYVMEKQFVHTGTDPYKLRYFSMLNFNIINIGFGVDDWVINTTYADMRDDKDITDIEKLQIDTGLTTINAVRAKHKDDPIPGGDTPYVIVGSQLIPIAHLPQLEKATPPSIAEAQAQQQQSLLGPGHGRDAKGHGSNARPKTEESPPPTGQGNQPSSAGVKPSDTTPTGDSARDTEGRPKRSTPDSASESAPRTTPFAGPPGSGRSPLDPDLTEEAHDFWCLLMPLSDTDAELIRHLRTLIDPADLVDPPQEPGDPHVTVLYGVTSVGERERRVCLTATAALPLSATYTAVSSFDQPDQDVLKLDVSSEDLMALNAVFRRFLPNEQTHPVYHPHITLAYLKPGTARKYAGALHPHRFTLASLHLVPPAGPSDPGFFSFDSSTLARWTGVA